MKRKTYERTPEIKEKMKKAALDYYERGGIAPNQGYRLSKQTKEKIRQAHLLYNQKLREEGKPHPLKGRIVPKDQRLKMSLAKKGLYRGPNHPRWKGGRKKSGNYFMIWSPYHPYRNPNNYVLEHRLVIEEQIKRFLKPDEISHHINGIPDDNRPENLMALKGHSVHSRLHGSNRKPQPDEIIFDGRNL